MTGSRTSSSHPLQVATIEVGGGRIGVTLCPGKKQLDGMSGEWDRDLAVDLQAIQAWGAEHLVTLIEEHEFVELQVEDLGQRATQLGLQWHHLPIPDGAAPPPAFEQRWLTVLPVLLQSLRGGSGVVIHCMGGLGRAGTVATRLLLAIEPHLTAVEAMARVRAARRGAIETPAQADHLLGLRR